MDKNNHQKKNKVLKYNNINNINDDIKYKDVIYKTSTYDSTKIPLHVKKKNK